MRALPFAIDRKRRSSHGARRREPISPKLFPNMTNVSNRPRSRPTRVTGNSRASRTPRLRETSTASGERSIPTTSCPRLCSSSATRPAPQPTSSTRPRARRIACRSAFGQRRNGAKYAAGPKLLALMNPSSRSTISMPSPFSR
jgi:hypothetical protein